MAIFGLGSKSRFRQKERRRLITISVLLPNASLTGEEAALKIFVIDWELSHLSSIAFDLGQMFAEVSTFG